MVSLLDEILGTSLMLIETGNLLVWHVIGGPLPFSLAVAGRSECLRSCLFLLILPAFGCTSWLIIGRVLFICLNLSTEIIPQTRTGLCLDLSETILRLLIQKLSVLLH